jgi:hypothetical protein
MTQKILEERFQMVFKKGQKDTFFKIANDKKFRSLGQYIRYLLHRDNGMEWNEKLT